MLHLRRRMSVRLLIPWFEVAPVDVQLPLLGSVTLHPFRVTTLAAIFVALLVAVAFASRRGRSVDRVLNLALYMVLFGFPISYLFDGLVYEPQSLQRLLRNPSLFLEGVLGFSMYGGVLGGIVGAWVWHWRTGHPIMESFECLTFGGPFGWCVARLGCFITHDHPGTVSEFFLAVADYRVGQPPFQPRHDLGLYDAIVLASIAVVFAVLGWRPRPLGFYVALLPLLYAPCRFLLDFLRAPALEGGDPRYGGLTPAQYGSVLLVTLGVVLMRRLPRR